MFKLKKNYVSEVGVTSPNRGDMEDVYNIVCADPRLGELHWFIKEEDDGWYSCICLVESYTKTAAKIVVPFFEKCLIEFLHKHN